MRPLETYLQELAQIRSTGANVKELSFYPALKELLNAAGNELKPKVRAVTNLRNQGAGMPDGGLFTASQFRRGADLEALSGQIPERGAIEVKSPREDAESVANGEQVTGYLDRYGLVLVSNLRDFILVQKTSGGASQIVERYTLAGDESAFWQMTRNPRLLT